ncbi:MAG: peptidoglycan DD-metalloendopeptidase family protein [Geminicoccaceae bacterium]
MAVGGLVYVLTAALTFCAVGLLASRMALADKDQTIAGLSAKAAEIQAQQAAAEVHHQEVVSALQATTSQQQEAISRLSSLHAAASRELLAVDQRLAEATAERDRALQIARSLDSTVSAQRTVASTQREALTTSLAALESRVGALVSERDLARRIEKGLRWRVEQLEQKLAAANAERDSISAHLKTWVSSQADAVAKVLAKAGVEIEGMLDRAEDDMTEGTGGPLNPLDGEGETQLASLSPDVAPTAERLEALRRLIGSLPLAQPLDEYRIMSGFGVRSDPITRRRAFHEGIDLSGSYDERVRATQVGTVVHAGRDGDYGVVVEIDHGMGISTRFAHLKGVLVREGQRVAVGQPIGIIGSTGRSTGRHLHYEVRLDGKAINPLPFLQATEQFAVVAGG